MSHAEAERRAAQTELPVTDGAGVSYMRWRKGDDDAAQSHHRSSRSRRHRHRCRIAVLRPLEMDAVHRLLKELAALTRMESRRWRGAKSNSMMGIIVCPWRIGGWHNRTAEEFALRLQQATGCVLADREHSRMIQPEQLEGLDGAVAVAQGTDAK